MNVRRLGAAVVIIASLMSAAACGNSSNSKTAGTGAGTAKDKAYNIGLVEFASSDETSTLAVNAYVAYAKKQGWTVTTVDPQGSLDKAINAMQTFVQKKVDLLIATVFPSENLTAGIVAAKAAGIPVMSFSGGIVDGVVVDVDSGAPTATDINKLLVDDMQGKGDLLVLGYKRGLPCLGREQDLDKQLEGTSIKVSREEVPIPGQVEGSTTFTQAWLAKHPKGSGNLAVWGCFDDPALGAVAALRQAGRTDVKVYGINGTPAAIQAVKSGDMRATSWLDVAAAATMLAEKTPEFIKAGAGAKAQLLPLPAVVVSTDTVADFLEEHPDTIN